MDLFSPQEQVQLNSYKEAEMDFVFFPKSWNDKIRNRRNWFAKPSTENREQRGDVFICSYDR